MIALLKNRHGFSITEVLFVLTISATLMGIGTPLLRGALVEQRLRASATEISNALAEARRESFRTSEAARVDVDPATRLITVLSRDLETNTWVERRRAILAEGVVFNNVDSATTYTFDSLGRPATLPMVLQLRSEVNDTLRTVTVFGTGRVEVN